MDVHESDQLYISHTFQPSTGHPQANVFIANVLLLLKLTYLVKTFRTIKSSRYDIFVNCNWVDTRWQ